MIRPVSFALVYGGNRSRIYARAMRDLMLRKSSDFPIVPLLVDTTAENGRILNYIEKTFNSSDYAFVFVSEAYCVSKESRSGKMAQLSSANQKRTLSMSTPNLMLELGYLLNRLGEHKIRIILDFSYDKVKNGDFAFPSDLSGNFLCPEPGLKNAKNEKVTELLSGILESWLRIIKRDERLSDINDILHGKVGLEAIFARELDLFKGYSLERQYKEIFTIWKSELSEFSQMNDINRRIKNDYIIMFLFSRILFFLPLHELTELNIDINDFRISKDISDNILDDEEASAINVIIDYIKGHNPSAAATFYKQCYEKLAGKTYRQLGLPNIIIKNYMGLACLNYARKATNATEGRKFFTNAYQLFSDVINASDELFGGSITQTILNAYAFYNRARAGYSLNMEEDVWKNDFQRAETERKSLSKREDFPLFIQNYYMNEAYHCVNGMIDSTIKWHNRKGTALPETQKENYKERENDILKELEKYEQTFIATTSFFGTVKRNARNNISKLQ